MKKTIEQEFSEKFDRICWSIPHGSINLYLRIDHIEESPKNGKSRYAIYRTCPINFSEVWHLESDMFHGNSIAFSLIWQNSPVRWFYEKYIC